MSLLRRLTCITVTKDFILRAAHIPGHHDIIADSLSHFRNSETWLPKHSKTDQCGNTTPIFIFRLNTLLSPYKPLLNYPSCPTRFSF